jgi:hypothetical protein
VTFDLAEAARLIAQARDPEFPMSTASVHALADQLEALQTRPLLEVVKRQRARIRGLEAAIRGFLAAPPTVSADELTTLLEQGAVLA